MILTLTRCNVVINKVSDTIFRDIPDFDNSVSIPGHKIRIRIINSHCEKAS